VKRPDDETRAEIVAELERILADARKGNVVAVAALSLERVARKDRRKLTLAGDTDGLVDTFNEASDLMEGADALAPSSRTPS
jgi:hypothetical protein